jgi:hypothetical protein
MTAECVWRKSSYSGTNGNCVEIGWGSGVAAIRDSKNPDAGSLTLPNHAFHALLTSTKGH